MSNQSLLTSEYCCQIKTTNLNNNSKTIIAKEGSFFRFMVSHVAMTNLHTATSVGSNDLVFYLEVECKGFLHLILPQGGTSRTVIFYYKMQ